MMLPSTDFESVASTSFATEASCEAYYTYFKWACQEKNNKLCVKGENGMGMAEFLGDSGLGLGMTKVGLADAEFLAGGAEFGQDFFFMIYMAVDHNGFAVAKDIRNARRIRRVNHMGSQIRVGR